MRKVVDTEIPRGEPRPNAPMDGDVVQIIPANEGWLALYAYESDGGELVLRTREVVCWARIVRVDLNDGAVWHSVEGMVESSDDDGRLTPVGDGEGFVCYVAPGCELDDYREQARRAIGRR